MIVTYLRVTRFEHLVTHFEKWVTTRFLPYDCISYHNHCTCTCILIEATVSLYYYKIYIKFVGINFALNYNVENSKVLFSLFLCIFSICKISLSFSYRLVNYWVYLLGNIWVTRHYPLKRYLMVCHNVILS